MFKYIYTILQIKKHLLALAAWLLYYRGADNSLARRLAGKKKLDDSSRLDVVEIARVPDMLPSFFSFLVGLRTYQHPCKIRIIL